MKISQNGINLIKKWEGCRLKAYDDGVGVWTIGYGHTRGVKRGQVITQEEADSLLRADLKEFEEGVTRLIGNAPTTQNQFDALVALAFNVGLDEDVDIRAEGLGDSSLLKAHNAGQHQKAAAKFLDWKYAGGRVLQGLINRRLEEQALYIRQG